MAVVGRRRWQQGVTVVDLEVADTRQLDPQAAQAAWMRLWQPVEPPPSAEAEAVEGVPRVLVAEQARAVNQQIPTPAVAER